AAEAASFCPSSCGGRGRLGGGPTVRDDPKAPSAARPARQHSWHVFFGARVDASQAHLPSPAFAGEGQKLAASAAPTQNRSYTKPLLHKHICIWRQTRRAMQPDCQPGAPFLVQSGKTHGSRRSRPPAAIDRRSPGTHREKLPSPTRPIFPTMPASGTPPLLPKYRCTAARLPPRQTPQSHCSMEPPCPPFPAMYVKGLKLPLLVTLDRPPAQVFVYERHP